MARGPRIASWRERVSLTTDPVDRTGRGNREGGVDGHGLLIWVIFDGD
jgi:hypothetical protein